VRATRLKALREARGLTQRRLAHDLGISQNYIPAIEAGTRRAGPRLQEQLTKYLRVAFEDIFDVVLVDPDSRRERQLVPRN
jgi:transcriptional regulator with XRE-family HTH domain